MRSGILGIDYYLPEQIETNADLARENPSWLMDRFEAKCGISARCVAAKDETASDFGFQAARKLLDRRLVEPEEIDFLLYCTQSPDYFLPTSACILQHRLGLKNEMGALDFNLGCSGYVYGLYLAKQFIETGAARNVLLITADTYTKYIHPRDRSVRPIFGDGAAATLVGRTEERGVIGPFVLGTDGAGAEKLIVPSGAMRLPRSAETAREAMDITGCVRSKDHLFMDGLALMNFAMDRVPKAVDTLLEKTGLTFEEIDWFIFHQANRFMMKHLANASKIPWERMVYAMEDIGNTVSASIPIAMARYDEQHKFLPSQKLVLVGFGVGYSWGACVVQW
ncbi:MAG TPA: ketoacyl-ACP synthase III [Thermoguttaceae bacterium]|nr:ketoacyl-ACP synthase III [Thermoguttaceae bacterium]